VQPLQFFRRQYLNHFIGFRVYNLYGYIVGLVINHEPEFAVHGKTYPFKLGGFGFHSLVPRVFRRRRGRFMGGGMFRLAEFPRRGVSAARNGNLYTHNTSLQESKIQIIKKSNYSAASGG
jgi:hypothetical protein